MKRYSLALLVAMPAHAGPYLELGIGSIPGGSVEVIARPSLSSRGAVKDYQGPFGSVEMGWRFGKTEVFVFHVSSMASEKDKGTNFIGVKHRFERKP